MKRISLLIILLMGLLSMMSLMASENSGQTHLALRINTTSNNSTEIVFECPEYTFEEISKAGSKFSTIKVNGAEMTLKAGYPELPFFTTSIAVPFGSHPVLKSERILNNETINNVIIIPSQGLEPDVKNFNMNETAYQSRSIYPENSIYISETQVFRDFNIITINYYPFSYNALEKKLIVNKRADIVIEHNSSNNSGYTTNGTISRVFDPLYRALIANYDQVRTDYPVFTDPTILMIYPNSTNAQFNTSLTQLINWKKQTGFKVNATSTTVAGTSTTAIKNYIQAQYDDVATRPDYLMIIGDASGGELVIPTYNLAYASGMPTGDGDDPYTFLAGNDFYADVLVGRLSAESSTTFSTLVSKIVNYERYPLIYGDAYLQKALLVGATSSSGISTVQVNQYVKDCIEYWDPSHDYTEIYGNPTGAQMVTGVNDGVFYFSFRGYIGMSGFSDSQVSSLTNVKKLVACVFLTCATGNIASSSMIETITRAGTSEQPKGAITAVGLSTSHTLTPYNNFLSCAIANGIFLQDITTMGGAVVYAQNKLLNTYTGDLLNHSKTLSQWCNLIGDPTINIHRSIPKIFTVNASIDSVYLGIRNMQVQVLDPDGDAVEGAAVTISYNSNEIITSRYTDSNGMVILPVSDAITTTMVLTVRKADFIINVKNIPMSSATGVINFDSYAISDAVNGNNNQQINPGETIKISSVVKNFSTMPMSNINVKMRSNNPLISITDSTAVIASLSAGSSVDLANEFSFDVDDNYTANQPIFLTFEFTVGTTVYHSYLNLEVKAIDLDIETVTILTPTGVINIGETNQLKIKLKNNGQINSGEVTAVIHSTNQFLQVVDSLVVYNSINPGQSLENNAVLFSLHSLSGILPGVNLSADLVLTNSQGYREVITFKVQVGTVSVTDPLPPDGYGYIAYDMSDLSYDDHPEYNWIDITTTGTVVPLTDTGDDQDDVETVTLPFTFKMYGKSYTQASICSNGWLALGVTQESTFRNAAIPGPMAPRSLIAPYWNDLAKSGTGSNVYTYYNATDHYYVVTWNNMKVVKTVSQIITTANVSFQVVLYDPLYNSTPLGDAPILMQYKDFHPGFNNDDLERPNNYFTAGIMDDSGRNGLQYVYNNIYSPGAAPLANETAVLYTQPYFLSDTPYLSLANPIIHDENGNGIIEAGELCQIGLPVVNVGMSPASNIQGSISSDSPNVTILHGTVDYVNIPPSGTATNIEYYTFRVSQDCLNDESIIINTILTSAEGEWLRSFNITVKKPSLSYRSFIINDATGNDNGILNAGETAKLVININNQSNLNINDLHVTLASSSPYITINTPSTTVAQMQGNSCYQNVFEIQLASTIPDETMIPIHVAVTSQNADPISTDIQLGVNQSSSLLSEGFDSWLPVGWLVQYYSSNWSLSETTNAGGSSPEVKFSGSPVFNGSTRIVSQPMDASDISSVILRFKHKLDVLSPGTIVGVATRSMYGAWHTIWSESISGSIAQETKTITITNSDLSRANFQICWYMEGNSANIDAWYIDDVLVQSAVGNSATVTGTLSLDDSSFDTSLIRIKAGEYSTTVNSEGVYSFYLMPGLYASVQALHPNISANTHANIILTSAQVLENIDFTANYASPVNNLSFNMNTNDHMVSLHWLHQLPENSPLVLSNFKVYRQTNSGTFDLVQTSTDMTFTEELDAANRYRYFVVANYGSLQSDSSNVIYVDPNTQANHDTPEVTYVFNMKQNYPNPFNPETNIFYSLAEKSAVSLKIFNIKGQLVKTLVNENQQKGQYKIVWNGQNNEGKRVGSGVYFIRMSTPKYQTIRKALLLK